MGIEQIQGYEDAVRALDANWSPRARHLNGLEGYVDGTQYAGRPDWFSDEKPLWERAPCIVYPIVRNAIDSNVDLLLGEGRFPVAAAEDLDGDDAEKFEAAVGFIVEQARFKAAAREIFAAGQGCGSSVAIFGLRKGRLFVEGVRAAWCEPELDVDGTVLRLEIKYPYLALEKDAGGKQVVRPKLFRRVIDDQTDTTFLPGEARADAVEPDWRPDPKQTVAHGFGFCPVVWFAHMKGCTIVGDVDGRAIHEHLTDEIRAHDFALSQRHRAALYAGDPQWTEIGVHKGYVPTGTGRRVEMPASVNGRPGEPVHAYYVTKSKGGARRKSPGTVWQYDGKKDEIDVKLHTLPGDALDALDKHARDIRVKLAEALGVVFLDPETMPQSTTLSGRALEALKSRQLDRCDIYRADFGDRFLLPALGMLLRIAIDRKLKIDGLDVVERVVTAAGDMWSWHSPSLCLSWGRYFRLESEEEVQQVTMVTSALSGGIATRRLAIEKLRGVFDIKDVDAYLAELEEEKAENMKRQQEATAAMAAAATKPLNEKPNGAVAKSASPIAPD